jgi:hypothetical protein
LQAIRKVRLAVVIRSQFRGLAKTSKKNATKKTVSSQKTKSAAATHATEGRAARYFFALQILHAAQRRQ